MTLCVIGKNSFIGKNLKADVKLDRNECNLLNYEETLGALNKHKPTKIINCAAKHGSFSEMSKDHTAYFEENLIMNINLLRASHELGIENVLLLGSISSFPFDNGETFDETNFFGGPVNEKNFGYNTSKRALVDLVKSYQLDYARNYKVAHLGNIYGPHARFDANATLVGNLIYQITQAKDSNSDIELYGDGSDVRSLTFVADLDQIFAAIIERKDQLSPVIVSSEEEISVKVLTKTISDLVGFKNLVSFKGPKDSSTRKVAKSKVLSKFLLDFEFTTLAIGLPITLEWFNNQQRRPSSVGRASLS